MCISSVETVAFVYIILIKMRFIEFLWGGWFIYIYASINDAKAGVTR
jgi:hypothetical protein